MPNFSVNRFQIIRSDVRNAIQLKDFDQFIFEFRPPQVGSTQLNIFGLRAAKRDGTMIAQVTPSPYPNPLPNPNPHYEPVTLVNAFRGRHYQITKAMLEELVGPNPEQKIIAIKIIALPTPYRYTGGNPNADPTDVNKEFISLKVDVDY